MRPRKKSGRAAPRSVSWGVSPVSSHVAKDRVARSVTQDRVARDLADHARQSRQPFAADVTPHGVLLLIPDKLDMQELSYVGSVLQRALASIQASRAAVQDR